jgi:hypothetical protein
LLRFMSSLPPTSRLSSAGRRSWWMAAYTIESWRH